MNAKKKTVISGMCFSVLLYAVSCSDDIYKTDKSNPNDETTASSVITSVPEESSAFVSQDSYVSSFVKKTTSVETTGHREKGQLPETASTENNDAVLQTDVSLQIPATDEAASENVTKSEETVLVSDTENIHEVPAFVHEETSIVHSESTEPAWSNGGGIELPIIEF